MMTDKYAIAIYDDGSGIGNIFREVAETVLYGLRSIGYDVEMCGGLTHEERRVILFNSNSLASFHAQKVFPAPPPFSIGSKRRPDLRQDTILYNLEPCSSFWLDYLLPLVKDGKHEVWDYSSTNVAWWKEQGVTAKYVPIGYVPELTRIKHASKEIDVLFYGGAGTPGSSITRYSPAKPERRMHVLWQCMQAGLNVKHLNGTFGEERDVSIAKAKIVLNVHRSLHHGFDKLETVRVSYLLANGACVVSEESVGKDGLDDAMVFAEHSVLAETCVQLIKDGSWVEMGRRGFEVFSKMGEGEILRSVMMTEKKPYETPKLTKLESSDPRADLFVKGAQGPEKRQ